MPKLLTPVGSSHASHPPPTAWESRQGGPRPPPPGRGFPGDTPPSRPRPRPVGPAPSAAAGRGRAAPSEQLRRGWGKLRWPVAFRRRCWLDRFNKSFFSLARSLSSGEQAEASVCSRRVRKRRTRSERKRPPVVSAAPHGPAPEKEPAFGRAASAGRRRLSPAPAPPRGISGPPARLGGPGAMLTGGLGNA